MPHRRVLSLARQALATHRQPVRSGKRQHDCRTDNSFANPGRGRSGPGLEWAAALELTIATNGAEPYKSRLKELLPQMITPQQIDLRGWSAVRALPYLTRTRRMKCAKQ